MSVNTPGETVTEALHTAELADGRAAPRVGIDRTAPLFMGARGRPPLDVDAIADVVSRVSWLAADLGPRLVDFEVNPLIVRRPGEGAVAVDSRGTLADPSHKELPS